LIASRFHVRADRVFVTGLPRNDPLVDTAQSRARLVDFLGEADFDRAVLYCPTHRQNPGGPLESSWTFDRFCDEYLVADLIEELRRRRILLVIKLHPFDELRGATRTGEFPPNVRLLTGSELAERDVEFYEILGGFDALWTDYSSIAADYLLTGRPVFYFVDDLDEYFETRGVMLGDFDLLAPGPRIHGVASLLRAIESWCADPGYYQEERDRYSRLMHTAPAPFSENLLSVLEGMKR
jgi:CDP-glycerol glycerophosphotransferase